MPRLAATWKAFISALERILTTSKWQMLSKKLNISCRLFSAAMYSAVSPASFWRDITSESDDPSSFFTSSTSFFTPSKSPDPTLENIDWYAKNRTPFASISLFTFSKVSTQQTKNKKQRQGGRCCCFSLFQLPSIISCRKGCRKVWNFVFYLYQLEREVSGKKGYGWVNEWMWLRMRMWFFSVALLNSIIWIVFIYLLPLVR